MDLVYHVFESKFSHVFECRRSPVVLSIATVRAFHDDVNIWVIDRTPNFHDWLDYPKRLNFQLLEPSRSTPEELGISMVSTRCCDIMHNVGEFGDEFFYVDSDIAWIKPFLPDMNEFMSVYNEPRGNFQFVNSGYFTVDKSKDSFQLFKDWTNLCYTWRDNKGELFDFLRRFNGNEHVTDESTLSFIVNMKGGLSRIVHSPEVALFNSSYFRRDESMVHFLTHFCGEDKIKAMFSIREVNSALRQVLNKSDFEKFGFDWEFKGEKLPRYGELMFA